MPSSIPAARVRIIRKIAAQARRRAGQRSAVPTETFIQAYYRGVAEEDLRERSIADLAGAALAHLGFGLTRRHGQDSVRIYTPEAARDGWNSSHTVVEIVTDDRPFLVDSLSIVFARARLAVHLTVHPILRVRRNRRGRLLETGSNDAGMDDPRFAGESWQRIEIDRLVDERQIRALQRQILATLHDVRLACGDWQKMRRRALTLCDLLKHEPPPLDSADLHEACDFLKWMADAHFTFVGYQELQLRRGRSEDVLEPVAGTALGTLRGRGRLQPVALRGGLRDTAREAQILLITKSSIVSTVRRDTHLDHIGIKRFDRQGRVVGEHRFLGLFTASAYQVSPHDIPMLRHKVQRVIDLFGLSASSHDGKAVLHVLEAYPRDELFQSGVAHLMRTVRGVVNLYERQRVRLFVRRDVFRRFYSCLLYVPRDRYSTQVRERIEALVMAELGGTEIESQVQLSESRLARLHMLVRTPAAAEPAQDVDGLEGRIAAAVRIWDDRLRDALIGRYGEAAGIDLARRYENAFPAAYEEDVSADDALDDLQQLLQIADQPDGLALRLLQKPGTGAHLRVLRTGAPLALSEALPLLENMGFRVLTERPYKVRPPNARALWIQDFELELCSRDGIELAAVAGVFRDAFAAVWRGQAESDGFNGLVVAAQLDWRRVAVLRAYCRYLLQTAVPFSQAAAERVLMRHARIAALLSRLFEAQFDPAIDARRRPGEVARLQARITRMLDAVTSLDEDRILRSYLTAISASLRTNYFQPDAAGEPRSWLSIKFDSRSLPHLPLPKPMFEIFVYSPRVEGVHLRNGRVARGGIRWSDRREDFRTEILGLMKAQNVKNTLIVPVGAKGGFVPKAIPANASRDDVQREGVECYRTFIRGLLDLTDNLVGGRIVPPTQVVRRDGDDPYLVVAADKGTASFSDIANALSAEYGFWLDDAFASGGSAGYDHKKMGITARGAWECVKRHFRELGIDVQSQAFTVAGIGDMSGDVFGNGMLLSKQIRLLAAFNHQHIFLDPAPDAAVSHRERERLFRLPRSTWEDYDRRLISRGGGIFARSAKSIRLAPQVRAMLGVDADELPPHALIQAILRMPVDLLWNGGIGTYVKAGDETHGQIGDRSNDALRVDGRELRCRVVGEGGNLGFSQRGRIEYAQSGGRINTDFIDNSAGVDCSDHEVNVKILLNAATGRDRLTLARRNRLLATMTGDIAALVLRDNYLQSQALSVAETVAAERLDEHAHLMRSLEVGGELNRGLEFLPSTEEIAERRKNGHGLTRPELAVLLAYSKMSLYTRLIESDVPEDPYLSQEVERYFPPVLTRRYGRLTRRHRLCREIIATATTNSLVNRMGPGFARSAQEDTGANAATVARAYTIAREVFRVRQTWADIEALDNRISTAVQYDMTLVTVRLLRFITYWLIRRYPERLDIELQVSRLQPGLQALSAALPGVLTGSDLGQFRLDVEKYKVPGVSEHLAARIAALRVLQSGPDIVEIAAQTRLDIERVAQAYFGLSAALGLDWIHAQVQALATDSHWQSVARGTLNDDLHGLRRLLCAQVLRGPRRSRRNPVDAWLDAHRVAVAPALQTVNDIRALPAADFATLSVALQAVRRLAVDG